MEKGINKATKYSIDDFRKALEKLSPEDFTGKTEFSKLSAEQRLLWLSEISRFVHKNIGVIKEVKRKKAG